MTCQFVRRTPQPDHVEVCGGSGASPVSPLPARAAPSLGARPWTIQRRDSDTSEIIDAGGNCFLIDTHAKVAEIAARVNEAGL